VQQLRPAIIRIADANCISMLAGLFRNQRDVRSSEHHFDALRPKMGGEFVGAVRTSSDHGQPDKVSLEVHRDLFDSFIVEGEFEAELRWCQGRQRGQR
jgi:hypothetical protein